MPKISHALRRQAYNMHSPHSSSSTPELISPATFHPTIVSPPQAVGDSEHEPASGENDQEQIYGPAAGGASMTELAAGESTKHLLERQHGQTSKDGQAAGNKPKTAPATDAASINEQATSDTSASELTVDDTSTSDLASDDTPASDLSDAAEPCPGSLGYFSGQASSSTGDVLGDSVQRTHDVIQTSARTNDTRVERPKRFSQGNYYEVTACRRRTPILRDIIRMLCRRPQTDPVLAPCELEIENVWIRATVEKKRTSAISRIVIKEHGPRGAKVTGAAIISKSYADVLLASAADSRSLPFKPTSKKIYIEGRKHSISGLAYMTCLASNDFAPTISRHWYFVIVNDPAGFLDQKIIVPNELYQMTGNFSQSDPDTLVSWPFPDTPD